MPAKGDTLPSDVKQIPSVIFTPNTGGTQVTIIPFLPTLPLDNILKLSLRPTRLRVELQPLKRSFAEQPNWKAALVE